MKKIIQRSVSCFFTCQLAFFAMAIALFATCNDSMSSEQFSENIVEENNLFFPVGRKANLNITEEIFNRIIEDIERIYSPIANSRGGILAIEGDWQDGTVNAYANRNGRQWVVHIFGGIARHPAMTADGLALVICHELGHHIAGVPKYQDAGSTWGSNEGQADYFASLKCMRRYFEDDNNQERVSGLVVPTYVSGQCSQVYTHAEDVAICKRTALAAKAVALVFSSIRGMTNKPDFTTPDTNRVQSTFDGHSTPQCRLDTFWAGSLCSADSPLETLSDTDATIGTCTKFNHYTIGLRPLCWYKPTIE